VAAGAPPVAIQNASQCWNARHVEVNRPTTIFINKGNGEFATQEAMLTHADHGCGVVQFSHEGRQNGFLYADNGSWMDIIAVGAAVQSSNHQATSILRRAPFSIV